MGSKKGLAIVVSIISILILAAVGVGIYFLVAPDKTEEPEQNVDEVINRLPRNLLPHHYNLVIKPVINTAGPPFLFSGEVTVFFECVETTNVLVLSAKRIEAEASSIKFATTSDSPKSAPTPTLKTYSAHPLEDELRFVVRENFILGARYSFHLRFTGVMWNPGEDGLYWDSYTGLNNKTKFIAATQLESIDARKMFPCFDEVDMKATFNISVQRLTGEHISISNMPLLQSVALADGWTEDRFDTTPKMSTYLVCVVVGDFKRISAPTPAGTNIKISLYATEVQVDNLKYMADFAVTRLQKWFDDNFGYRYKEPKMDHVALPSKSGAMENWGIITYGEEILCIDNETTSVVGKFNGVTIVSHEISHMWFGNLVTCKWWTDLWIQEGFATNYNYNPTEALGWDWMLTQLSDARRGIQNFLSKDQKNTTEPIRKHVASPQVSEASFTSSAYNKGGALIRFLQGILSHSTLQRALTKYLKRNEYSNTETKDLAAALNEQASLDGITYPDKTPLDFNKFLDPWLNQIGYPLVTVKNKEGTLINVAQSMYLHPRSQTVSVASKFNYQWEIPFTVVTTASTEADWNKPPTNWMHVGTSEMTFSIPLAKDQWYILNPRQNFFYRVLYDVTNRIALVNQLGVNHEKILPETRGQLLDDNFDLARNSYLSIKDALEFTKYLGSELVYNPWESTLRHVNFISPFFIKDHFYAGLAEYFAVRLDKVLDKIGYEFPDDETVLTTFLRKDAIASACSFGSKKCLAHIRSLYKNYIVNPAINSVHANAVPTVLCQGVYEGTEKDWNLIYEQYNARKSSQVKDERHAYIFALTCANDTSLLDRIFDDIVNGKTFISKDVGQATQYLASTEYGASKLWKYLDDNWKKPATGISKLTTMNTITNKWYTAQQLKELNDFVAGHSLTSSEQKSLTQNVLQVELNIEFYTNNKDLLEQWLNNNVFLSNRRSISTLAFPPSAFNHWEMLQNLYRGEKISRSYQE